MRELPRLAKLLGTTVAELEEVFADERDRASSALAEICANSDWRWAARIAFRARVYGDFMRNTVPELVGDDAHTWLGVESGWELAKLYRQLDGEAE